MHKRKGYFYIIPNRSRKYSSLLESINNVYMRVGEGVENYTVVPAKELIWVQDA